MPIYKFVCPKCKEYKEFEYSILEYSSLKYFPLCLNEGCSDYELERVIENTTFVLKGSGWYKDGYSK